jgi:hypothetical protein
MSPEQAQGRPVDARSDIFCAAAVFYFMVSGRSAFGSTDLRKVLQAILKGDPTPLTDAEAPEPLRRVLTRGLAKVPAERYQRCEDMQADLERARRAYTGATYRIIEAATARYRRTRALIEEQRAIARSLGAGDADESADAAVARLAERFPLFAGHEEPAALLELIDRDTASAALEELQLQQNAEQAALAALEADAAGREQPDPQASPSRKTWKESLWRGGQPRSE